MLSTINILRKILNAEEASIKVNFYTNFRNIFTLKVCKIRLRQKRMCNSNKLYRNQFK